MSVKRKISAHVMEEITSSSPRFEHHCYTTCPEKTYSEELECKACDTNCGNCDQHECYWCEEGFFLLSKSKHGIIQRELCSSTQAVQDEHSCEGFQSPHVLVPLVQEGILI